MPSESGDSRGSNESKLADFVGSIATATTDAPDEYPTWSYWTFETHMADLRKTWSSAKPMISRDIEKAAWVEENLMAMIRAFESGNKATGRSLAWALYNANIGSLR